MRLSHPTGEQNIFVGLLLLLILFHVAIFFTGKKYVLNVMEEEPPVGKTNNNDSVPRMICLRLDLVV